MSNSHAAPTSVALKQLAATRPIVLVGLRGVGKTTVGRVLAEHMSRTFLDLDTRVLRAAQRVGLIAPDTGALLTQVGQARFRDLEATELRQIIEPGIRCVLASGGGAVERADSRAWLTRAAACVWLTEDLDRVAARVQAGGATRPALLGGEDSAAELAELLARRTPWYSSVSQLRVVCGGRTPVEIAKEIATELGMTGSF